MPYMTNDTIFTLLNAINPYHWITWLRNRTFDYGIRESRSFETPTICIGNITVGGTGKTPHTEYLIELLQDDYRIAVLSRGYGRKSRGFVSADSNTTARDIGDEPCQMANKFNKITVAVDEKRVRGIETLERRPVPPQVILLDDAFQHRHVKAGLNILLIDRSRPVWNDTLLPIGRLRESANGIKRADIIIITKCPPDISTSEQIETEKRCAKYKNLPIFFSTMQYGTPYPLFPQQSEGHMQISSGTDILLVTGIARPAPLKAEIERRGAQVILKQYPDHHSFSDKEIADIATAFSKINSNNKLIATTEKDATRLKRHPALPQEIKKHIYVIPIKVSILHNKENMFNQIISDYVRKNQTDCRIP